MNDNIGVNLRIEILKQNIVALIGESQLPVGMIYYILKDLFDEITNTYQQSLTLEQESLKNSSEQKKTEENTDEIIDESNDNEN